VAPLLYRSLESSTPRIETPQPVLEALQLSYQQSARRNAKTLAQLAILLDRLGEDKIRVIVLKGAHLAEIVYGDAGLRPMSDVDLWVKEADVPGVEIALQDLGYVSMSGREAALDYSQHRHLAPFVKPGCADVEVHVTLERSPLVRLDEDGMWERAVSTRIGGSEALVLSPEDLLLHLCLHMGFQDRFKVSLRHLCDIPAVIRHFARDLDWDRFVRASRAWRLEKICYYALATAKGLLGAGVPAEALAALKTEDCDEDLVSAIGEFILLHRSHPLPDGIREGLREQGSRRATAFLRAIFPPLSRMRAIYDLRPDSRAAYLYYLARPCGLLLRRSGFLLRLAARDATARLALELEAKGERIERMLGR
jgi:hypothetical protein